MAGAAGLWSGLQYSQLSPHGENKNKPLSENEPRFQMMDAAAGGAYVGSGFEMRRRKMLL